MGGEGVNWAASSIVHRQGHIFQNLGEGTYYHSGSMAIRQAIAAKANITYKILYNDAVAMTGGQPVDGPISVQAIAHSVRAEGWSASRWSPTIRRSSGPFRTSRRHDAFITAATRRGAARIARHSGVTVLIYEQTCATEKRRRRKRGTMETRSGSRSSTIWSARAAAIVRWNPIA
jgi:indolepyruvate ferredoxin oxidoreductase